MIKKIILVSLFLTPILGISQTNKKTVLINETIIGKNLLNQKDLKAVEYVFGKHIHDYSFYLGSELLTVILRDYDRSGKFFSTWGEIETYSLKTKTMVWFKKVNFNTSDFLNTKDILIYRRPGKYSRLNNFNGRRFWKRNGNLFYIDELNNIGICYGMDGSLRGTRLDIGKEIWKNRINLSYGINDKEMLNDSIILITAGGLLSLNIKKGYGWSYNAITGRKDYRGTIAANTAGIALGLLTGTYVITTGHNVVRDICSNALIDSLNIYFASKENLSKINKQTGSVQWSYQFSKKFSSKSFLFQDEYYVYMINQGYGKLGYKNVMLGIPSISAYDKESGEQKYLSVASFEKERIVSYQERNGTAVLFFDNKIARYDLFTGKKLHEVKVSHEKYGALVNFLGEQNCIRFGDNTFASLVHTDTSKVYVFTNKEEVLVFDEQFNISERIQLNELFRLYLEKDGLKFLEYQENKSFILNKENKIIADLDVSKEANLIDNYLYDLQGNKLIKVDLKSLVNK